MASCAERLSPSSDLTNESETSLTSFAYENQNGNYYPQNEINDKQYYSSNEKSPRNDERITKNYLQENKIVPFDYLPVPRSKKNVNYDIKLPPTSENFFPQIENEEPRPQRASPFYDIQNLKSCIQESEMSQNISEIKVNGQVQFDDLNLQNDERDRVQANYFADNENNNNNMRRCLHFNAQQVQCVCEALQQKGDIEKLAAFLWNLPPSELMRGNETVLR